MKVYVIMDNICGWVTEVCKTKECAEQFIKKDIDERMKYFDTSLKSRYHKPRRNHKPRRKDYVIEKKELLE